MKMGPEVAVKRFSSEDRRKDSPCVDVIQNELFYGYLVLK